MTSAAPFRIWTSPASTPLIRVWLENGMNCIPAPDSVDSHGPAAKPVFLFYQDHDAAAFGSLVGKRCQLGSFRQIPDIRPVNRDQFDCLPVAERDRAGLVEQEDIDVARCLDGPAGGGDDIAPDQPVHPGDADGTEQSADGGRCKADKQGDKHGDRDRGTGTCGLYAVDRERPERCTDNEKYEQSAR